MLRISISAHPNGVRRVPRSVSGNTKPKASWSAVPNRFLSSPVRVEEQTHSSSTPLDRRVPSSIHRRSELLLQRQQRTAPTSFLRPLVGSNPKDRKDSTTSFFAGNRPSVQSGSKLQPLSRRPWDHFQADTASSSWRRVPPPTRATSPFSEILRNSKALQPPERIKTLSELRRSPQLPRPSSSNQSTLLDITKLRESLLAHRKPPSLMPLPPTTSNTNKTATDPSTSSSTTADYSLSLSEFVRRKQLENAQREKPVMDWSKTPLPQWRLVDRKRLRDTKQKQEKFKEQNMKVLKKQEPKKDYVDPKTQTVVLPAYQLSLPQVSQLLRESSQTLRKMLQEFGVLSRAEDSRKNDLVMVDTDAMELLALELGIPFERTTPKDAPSDKSILMKRRAAAEQSQEHADWKPRPAVVAVCGHVDHGKTTLMDALRRRSINASNKPAKRKDKKAKTADKSSSAGDVAGTEAGGITQAITAFQVPILGKDEPAVTFLDTPGHAAFKAMRQSGSDAADILVLVIAADDGVSAQTVEILELYKSIVKDVGSGGISLVVAMNKIDKPGVDINESRRRIESELLGHGIITEGMSSEHGEFGAPVQLIPMSGLTGEGLDDFIEALSLQSEIMDLRADESARAEGVVIDARIEKGLGVVVDIIVRHGSISRGDVVVSGSKFGKVRILKDMSGNQLKAGLPAQPVSIVGFEEAPRAGDAILVVASEEDAEDLTERRLAATANDAVEEAASTDAEVQFTGRHLISRDSKAAMEEKYGLDGHGNARLRIPVIIKADADGSLAAIRDSILQMGQESTHDVEIELVRTGIGSLLPREVELAAELMATVVCFNVKADQAARSMADEVGVSILQGDIIYKLLDGAREAFSAHLPETPVEVVHGRGKVKAVYDIGGMTDRVAGLAVMDGKLYKEKTIGADGVLKCRFRVLRKGEVVGHANLRASSLKHFKLDVDEVSKGKDCGLSLSGHKDFEEGDVVECFSVEMRRELL